MFYRLEIRNHAENIVVIDRVDLCILIQKHILFHLRFCSCFGE